ncbi:lipopolysaccharide export system ATP-binding protein [Candidatus Kinetoplastibacterium blastocrithidii (ex Strigomonas culicis)]|nr:lipopolysaccharide export system ATP-binding protein [Candidatus Kinetoplastibacterium blastocrithidii (ex Strigomonas culicis)]
MLTNIIENCKNDHSILKANNLKKSYNGRNVIKDISLYLKNGEVVGLLGPNGAGKTTSFYMVLGIIPTDSGSIEINEEDITNLPIHKRSSLGISYLPQDASIFRGLTVENNIKAILELQKKNGKRISKLEIEIYTNELLDKLHISYIRHSMAISLSGGERRRVEIARALATKPKFILLDEPFAGVDPISILEIQKIIFF